MKQILLIAILFCSSFSLCAQDSIPVGSNSGYGSTAVNANTFGPMMTNTTGATWNRHAYIYPSSLYAALPSGTVLNAIGFPRFTLFGLLGTLSGTVSLKVYLKNTTAADFGAGSVDWTTESAAATLVYNGTSADITSTIGNTYGLKKFPFSKNFIYTGGNIEILVEYTQSAAATGEVIWGYDNNTTITSYTTNQVKYASGTTSTPSSTTLSTATPRHPATILYFSAPSCSGTPNGGKIPNTVNVCHGSYTALIASGYSIDNGIKIKWEQASAPTGPWTAVKGGSVDTQSLYLTANLYNTTYFRLKVTCTATNDSAFSNVDTVNVTHQPSTLPLWMGFNSNTTAVECLTQDQVTDTTLLSITVAPSIVILSNIGNPTLTPSGNINPHDGDRLLKFNSYDCDPYDAIRVNMPEITTKGLTGVDMYYYYYQINGHKASNDRITVQYSLDKTNWVSVPSSVTKITNTALDSTNNGWKKVFLSLPAAVANKDSVWIGFLLTSGNGYNILIDEIKIGATGTLPVKYIDITAEKTGVMNKINWSTYEEKGNSLFEIERSANSTEFISIGKMNTKADNGNSNTTLHYNYNDAKPLAGNNYYRIKQTDLNGNISYSDIVLVKGNKLNTLSISSIFPNPATNNTIKVAVFSPEASVVTTTITDIAGKTIKQFSHSVTMGNNQLELNVAGVERGSYIIKTVNQQSSSNALMFEKR